MILNISGRTDIVAFYCDWLMNRLEEGYVDVRNPFNPKMVSRIMIDDVDLLFFCTKNPLPILDKINNIKKKMYFHITLTSYKKNIEHNVPSKKDIIEGIKKLSEIVGKENIVIRYDPVLVNDEYTVDYDIKAFDKLCDLLDGYISKMLISFIDDYKNVRNNYSTLKYRKLNEDDYKRIGESFSKSAKKHNILVHTCAEVRDLTEYGFIKDECMSKELAFKLTGKTYKRWNARKNVPCKCIEMADIGVYNSCKHFCKYCYANFDEKQVNDNYKNHNPKSSLLIGWE
jgi:DNA repair photolyase